jgi:hypothetical protein
MDPMMLTLRLLHVTCGVFWAGAMIFSAIFLVPAMRDAGPEGAKVAAALAKRRMMDVMPVIALVTILSGLWLYWRVSGGFNPEWMGTPTAMALGTGAIASLVAFIVGVTMVRPSMLKAGALAASLAEASPAEKEAKQATITALRSRATAAGRAVAALLIVAVITMAVARVL